MLPGGICVSFANSPELALRDCWAFYREHPNGADFGEAVKFFEASSKSTSNEYLLAFAEHPKIIKIADGKRQPSVSKTLWIGDKAAFEAFREFEFKKKGYEAGRAINAVLFADEVENSPASDLYSAMRHLALDSTIESVGGFICVISNRGNQFRHSAYCDMLYNWPVGAGDDYQFDNNDRFSFGASGENEGWSTSQFCTGYGDFNCVGFYLLKARIAYLFHPASTLLADSCTVIENVSPGDLEARLREIIKTDLGWLIFIATASPRTVSTVLRPPHVDDTGGAEFGIWMRANTFPPKDKPRVLPVLTWKGIH